MFAVPEVDDDIDVATTAETKQSITLLEATRESLPPPPPPPPLVEKKEKNRNKIQYPSPPPPPPPPPTSAPISSKQHRSRRSHFLRNTIHICDQIVDRV